MRRVTVAVAAAALVLGLVAADRPVQAAAPPAYMSASPPGANDWACQPTTAHPDPVVLVHGLGANMSFNWTWLAPRLARRGFCVYALTYGVDERYPYFGGVRPMEESAAELAAFVEEVLEATGAAEVDIVGHSEGSLMPNHYVTFLGGAEKVSDYVALTPLWQGTQFWGLGTLYQYGRPTGLPGAIGGLVTQGCGSCTQFLPGSPFLTAMHEGGVTVPGVSYTNIVTKLDVLVVPYTSGVLDEPGVTNHVLQDVCATDLSDHVSVAHDVVVEQLILNAIDPAGAQPPPCELVLPFLGSLLTARG